MKNKLYAYCYQQCKQNHHNCFNSTLSHSQNTLYKNPHTLANVPTTGDWKAKANVYTKKKDYTLLWKASDNFNCTLVSMILQKKMQTKCNIIIFTITRAFMLLKHSHERATQIYSQVGLRSLDQPSVLFP
jgi:hypothetical protein